MQEHFEATTDDSGRAAGYGMLSWASRPPRVHAGAALGDGFGAARPGLGRAEDRFSPDRSVRSKQKHRQRSPCKWNGRHTHRREFVYNEKNGPAQTGPFVTLGLVVSPQSRMVEAQDLLSQASWAA
jgi:hypothetical protein